MVVVVVVLEVVVVVIFRSGNGFCHDAQNATHVTVEFCSDVVCRMEMKND